MRKSIFTLLCGLLCSLAVSAQTPFEKGKFYVSTGLTGLDLTYDKSKDWNMGLTGKVGCLFDDNWMITGQASLDWHKVAPNRFTAGAGLRYYI